MSEGYKTQALKLLLKNLKCNMALDNLGHKYRAAVIAAHFLQSGDESAALLGKNIIDNLSE